MYDIKDKYRRKLFDNVIENTLQFEGGYSKCKSDPGGETKYGISKRSYPYLDIKNLTLQEAKDIYFLDFWIKYKCYLLHNEKIAAKFFDLCVNLGGHQATKLLQKSINSFNHLLTIDGIIGLNTINTANLLDHLDLMNKLISETKMFYIDISERKTELKIFLAGWLRRADYRLA